MHYINRRAVIMSLLGIVIIAVLSSCNPVQHADLPGSASNVIVFPLAAEPPTLNSYLSQTGIEALIGQMIYESLTDVGPNGEYIPVLASQIPSKENGGMSDDGLTITWRLRKDVVWSDGIPFTSDDVKFTWEAINREDNGVVWNPGVSQIADVQTPDVHTVVIKYSSFYPEYLSQFSSRNSGGQGILPRHACGTVDDMLNWACNREPVGTGPFMLQKWLPGESITLVRNPKFREPGKPYADMLYIPIIPDSTSHYQMLLKGDAHVWWNLDQQYLKEFATSDQVKLAPGSQQYVLRFFFNLNTDSADSFADPHPFLSDKKVRQAIRAAIDPNAINQSVYSGLGTVAQHEMFQGVFACPTPKQFFNQELARSLLAEAGYKDMDSDGILECESCATAEKGAKIELSLVTSNDEPSLSLVQQVIAEQLRSVGIRILPELDATFEERALAGDFDIMMWADGFESTSDPAFFLSTYYDSASIPQYNIMRYANPVTDQLLAELINGYDESTRKDTYCQLDAQITEDIPLVFTLAIPYPSVFSAKVTGWQDNANAILTWDVANWRLNSTK